MTIVFSQLAGTYNYS